jgi:hypothetical protein
VKPGLQTALPSAAGDRRGVAWFLLLPLLLLLLPARFHSMSSVTPAWKIPKFITPLGGRVGGGIPEYLPQDPQDDTRTPWGTPWGGGEIPHRNPQGVPWDVYPFDRLLIGQCHSMNPPQEGGGGVGGHFWGSYANDVGRPRNHRCGAAFGRRLRCFQGSLGIPKP